MKEVKVLKKAGNILIALGVILIAAALLLTAYNLYDQSRADKAASDAVEKICELIPEVETDRNSEDYQTPAYVFNPDMEMPVKVIDGYSYIGYLEIPNLSLRLPVMSEWSYPNLKKSPCRYVGTAYKSGFVIAAHNYSRHFGGIKNLPQGAEIRFTDMDGNAFKYKVISMEVLDPYDSDEMIEGDWDMTLFTCTIGGKTRITIRCAYDY